MADPARASTAATAAPSSNGAYRAVFFRTATSGRSVGRQQIAGWSAGSCGRAVAAWAAGSPARAGDAWLAVIGWSPLLGVLAVFRCLRLSLLSLSVAVGPGVRTGVSLLVLPAGGLRTNSDKGPGQDADWGRRMAAPGWAALAWSGPGRFPGEGAGRTWVQAGPGGGGGPETRRRPAGSCCSATECWRA